ncbi:unnamed protein product [Sympodiomycopsis kandeliae]
MEPDNHNPYYSSFSGFINNNIQDNNYRNNHDHDWNNQGQFPPGSFSSPYPNTTDPQRDHSGYSIGGASGYQDSNHNNTHHWADTASTLPRELDPTFQHPIFVSPSAPSAYPVPHANQHQQHFGGYPSQFSSNQSQYHQFTSPPHTFSASQAPPFTKGPEHPDQYLDRIPHQSPSTQAFDLKQNSVQALTSSAPRNRTQALPPTFSDSEGEGELNIKKSKKADTAKNTAKMVSTRGAGAPVNYAEQMEPADSSPPRRGRRSATMAQLKKDDTENESDVSIKAIEDESEDGGDHGDLDDNVEKDEHSSNRASRAARRSGTALKLFPDLEQSQGKSGSHTRQANRKATPQSKAHAQEETLNNSSAKDQSQEEYNSSYDQQGQRQAEAKDPMELANVSHKSNFASRASIHKAVKSPAATSTAGKTTPTRSSARVAMAIQSTSDIASSASLLGKRQLRRSQSDDQAYLTLTSSMRRISRPPPSYKEETSSQDEEPDDSRNEDKRRTKSKTKSAHQPGPSRSATARASATIARSALNKRPAGATTGSKSIRSNARSEEEEDSSNSSDPLAAPIREDDDEDAAGESEDEETISAPRKTRSGRNVKSNYIEPADGSDDEDEGPARRRRAAPTSKTMNDFVVDDEDENDSEIESKPTRSRGRLSRGNQRVAALANKRRSKRPGGRRDSFVDDEMAEEEDDMSGDDSEGTDDQGAGRSYGLRQRKKVDYSLAGPPTEPQRDGFGRVIKNRRGRGGASDPNGGAFELDAKRAEDFGLPTIGGRKGKTGWDALPLSMTGKDYAQAFGDEVDSSDDDIPAARKANRPQIGGAAAGGLLGGGPTALGGGGGGAGAMAGNEGSARDAFGRIKKGGDALADVDPLGVNMQVDFNSVGGLDGHIQQLKEMVSLPLLYPEVFQRFKVTPPRGVLFHGPPGTGKTLVARALAASCSSSGQQISFFMRKGADCLSKWVGEAERQLRMLFDEARASQPSIIFFDEIDGLAPVRSSKQDQIHASIVSTLLALMDGMDGRGQVVVIGATNRPDSVDPALRRPGRFDREFYFPLPSKEGRRSIIDIHTKGWEPPLSDDFKDKLAEVTKGYGGADMRALCTEAALNAVQRRYPQIYQTTERLLLQPETIQVDAKDFMMSVNKIVPSSARSASSAAAPLPDFLKPILGQTVEQSITALQKVMPPASKRNPLEEALWEDEPTGNPLAAGSLTASASDGGFGREMMLQSFETLRIFRPRLVIYGNPGMGQSFVGAALLHHLEGYHVQSLDIGALMGDSARTPEAAVVQLFVEAKRHKPSVVFIPGLIHWAHSVSETVRATTKALLDELSPSDPILLLAIAEGPLLDLPHDVAKWFGYLRDNKVEATLPSEDQRRAFFAELLQYVTKPPTEFPDALPRRRRVLEELPIAPPRQPREPTAAELQQQVVDDQRTLEHLKYRLGPILSDLRKKYKKFTRDVWDEYNLVNLTQNYTFWREKGKVIVRLRYAKGALHHFSRRASSVDEEMLRGAVDKAGSQGVNTLQEGAINSDEASRVPQIVTNGDVSMGEGARLDGPEPSARPSQGQGPASAVEGADTDGGSSTLAGAMATGLMPNEQTHPSSQPSPVTNGIASNVPNVPASAQPNVAKPPQGSDEDHENFDYRDMPIWTMTLEKMQRRLYYNGYLTLDDFVLDLNKIVDNAEEAREVDAERLVRAHQMRNYAVVLLDQYIDVAFREDCQRMAQRQLAREREKAQAEADAKTKAEAAAAVPRRPSGERFSARVQGQAPEHSTPVDVLAIERINGKRSRGSSVRASGGDGGVGEDGERKRARSSFINEVDAEMSGSGDRSTNGASGVVGTTASDSSQAQIGLQVDPVGVGQVARSEDTSAPGTGTAPPVEPVSSTTSLGLGPIGLNTSSAIESATGSDPIPHPSFNCPRSLLEQLEAKLLQTTSSFSIDQLLQLRAACFDQVWRNRGEWDRLDLIATLRVLVDEVAEAVRVEKEHDHL